jgi:hypothetical protein
MVGLHIFWTAALKFGRGRESAPQDPREEWPPEVRGAQDLSAGIVPVPKYRRQLFVGGHFERKDFGDGVEHGLGTLGSRRVVQDDG